MKKKVTRPDGTVVEYEGTVDELRELEEDEHSEEKNESKKTGRRLLNEERARLGAAITELIEAKEKLDEERSRQKEINDKWDELMEPIRKLSPQFPDYYPWKIGNPRIERDWWEEHPPGTIIWSWSSSDTMDVETVLKSETYEFPA